MKIRGQKSIFFATFLSHLIFCQSKTCLLLCKKINKTATRKINNTHKIRRKNKIKQNISFFLVFVFCKWGVLGEFWVDTRVISLLILLQYRVFITVQHHFYSHVKYFICCRCNKHGFLFNFSLLARLCVYIMSVWLWLDSSVMKHDCNCVCVSICEIILKCI